MREIDFPPNKNPLSGQTIPNQYSFKLLKPKGGQQTTMKDIDKDTLTEALARNTLDDIPTPKSDAKEIVGLVKSSGRVTGYQLSDGSTVSKQDGVNMAKDGDIKGVGIAHRKDTEYLKSLPDDTENNNLNNLPSVSG